VGKEVREGRHPLGGGDPTAPALLDMQQITKDFPGGRVLHGVDFSVRPGQVHALVGENGAGKSTLMKILAGLYPDFGGEIRIDGTAVGMRSPKEALDEGVAVIYQEFAQAPDFTVAENIALGRESRGRLPGGISHRDVALRSASEAAALGIELPMDALVADLGVGDQQLTEIVKAVARQARVLVMDEPTARLSSTERDRLFSIIEDLAGRGVGVVYISHFLEEVFAVASEVTVLRDGHRVTTQPLSDLNLRDLAKLMVGEKFQDIQTGIREHLARHDEDRREALVLEGFGVEGKVAPIDLTLHRGEVIGFAGLQGSGRTDLAEALIGSSTARHLGRIRTPAFTGVPSNPRQALEAGLVMLPANRKTHGILEVRPVAENVAVAALRRKLTSGGVINRGRRASVVTDLLERFAVKPKDPSRQIRSLSGGNQQKVLFARAAAAEAEVLVLDQPTAGVDVGATVELYERIDAMTQAGVGVILISDDLTELLRLSDRIVLMKGGVAQKPKPANSYDRSSLLAAITGELPVDLTEGATP